MLSVSLSLAVPPSSCYGMDNSLTIDYCNTGTSAAPAPVVMLSATNASLWLPSDPAVSGSSLQVLATGPSGPAGTLAPGASGTIVVDFTSTSSTGGAANFSLGQLTPGQTINWSSLQSGMRPGTISTSAWPAVFANLTANLGGTTTSYQAALDADATYLAQLGEPTNDVARLVTYEINKANDSFSTTTLGDHVDATLPIPGSLSLSFERWFQPGVSARYQMGTLGLGWTNNWAITASSDSQGNVTINESGSLRYFSLRSNGSYLGTFGDDGVLAKLSGGGYKLTEADGSSTVFNANGTLDYVQDSNGNRITAAYTGGLLTQLTASNGEYLHLTYSASGLLTKVTDSTGEVSTYTYDAVNQHLLSYTDEFGTTSYTYVTGQGAAAQNALASVTFSDNSHDYFSYDAEGRLIDEHQDNDQQDVKLSYGAAGGCTATDTDGNTSTMLADDNGQVCETIDGLGNVTRYSYDISGDLTAVNGPQGSNYAYTYDSQDNLTSATDPLGLTTQFTYNASNDLTSYTDAKGNTTSYAYDSSNDLLSATYANGAKEQYSYNPLGEATQFVNANGKAIGATYNSRGLVTKETFADGSSYSYTYDVHGNMLTATSAGGTITFQYQDAANPDLLTEVEYPNSQYLKFTYNAIGRRTQSVDQTGFTVNYDYDALGRLQELTGANGNLIVQYIYDTAGNLSQQNNGNGTFTLYAYDHDGDVLSITNYAPSTGNVGYNPAKSTVNSFDHYTYDALGNVLTDTNQDGQWGFTYDADSQLIHAVFTPSRSDPDGLTGQNLQYVYGAAGNRISQTVNGVITTYAVNNVNEYTTSTTNGVTTSYRYDNDGNLVSQTAAGSTTTYSYNELDELTGVTGPGQAAAYTYDPLGNRNSQTVNGVTTQFQIGPDGLASTYSGSGGLIAHYTYGFGLVSQVSASGIAGYYDFNLTGDTIGITGAAGSYVNKYSYLPFGQTTTITATLANPFTFVGQFGVVQDGAALFDMEAREYSAATGQFLSDDPLGLAGGDANVRRYVANNPANAVDAEGNRATKVETKYSGSFGTARYVSRGGCTITTDSDGVRTITLSNGQPGGTFYPGGPHVPVTCPDGSRETYWADSEGTGKVNGVVKMEPAYTTDASGTVKSQPQGVGIFKVVVTSGGKVLGKGLFPYQLDQDGLPVHSDNEPLPPPQALKSMGGDPDGQMLFTLGACLLTYVAADASGSSKNIAFDPTSNFYPGYCYTDEVAQVDLGGPITSITSATTSFTDAADSAYDIPSSNVVTTWQAEPGDPSVIIIYAKITFLQYGEYGYTVIVNGNHVVEDPGHAAVIVYEAPVIVNPVNFTMPSGGQYSGPLATFTDLGANLGANEYTAALLPKGDGSITSIVAGPDNSYTVYGNVKSANLEPNGSYSVEVSVSNSYQAVGALPWGTGEVSDAVAMAAAGKSQCVTNDAALLELMNGSSPAGNSHRQAVDLLMTTQNL